MLLASGTKVARLTLARKLGQGGFGITYLAHDARGAPFALKEYFPSKYATRRADNTVTPLHGHAKEFQLGYNAFHAEAFTLKDLPSQRGLVRVRGAFKKYNTVYCIMDFVDGVPLDEVLRRYATHGRTVEEALLIDFLRDLASALCAVHGADILHRDIKPGNVIIRRETREPVLIDFGAARRLADPLSEVSMLSIDYAPIEFFPDIRARMRKKLQEGPKSDVFSLSTTLYEMIIGRAPLPSRTRLDELLSTGTDPYVPVAEALARSGRTGSYSAALTSLVDRGCALHPDDRPDSAEMLARIERLAGPRSLAVSLPDARDGPPPVVTKGSEGDGARPAIRDRGSGHKIAVMLLLILVLAFGAALYAKFSQ